MSGLTDEQLVARARTGSQRAYRSLVERYERPVFNLVARMVRDRTLAEDLAQESFVKAFSRLDSYRPEQGKFSNWMFKIAHNTAIDHLRRGALSTVSIDPSEPDQVDLHARIADEAADSPLDLAVVDDLGAALAQAVARLRPEYREAVVLRHQEGLAYEEIAEIMELPLGTVKTYLHRARKEMAGVLTAAGWGPGAGAPAG